MQMSTDRWVAIAFLLLVAVYWGDAETYEKVMRADVMGPRFFPRIIAAMGVCLAIWLFWTAAGVDKTHHGGGRFRRELAMLIPLFMFFVFVLCLQPVGFLIATFVYLTVSIRYLGQPTWLASAAFAVALTAAVYGLFDMALGIPLPEGTIFKAML